MRTKNLFYYTVFLFCMVGYSCTKDEAEKPQDSFKAFTATNNGDVIATVNEGGTLVLAPGQKIYLKYSGDRETKVAFWPGDYNISPNDSTSHNYDDFVKSGGDVRKYQGVSINQSLEKYDYVYTYSYPGKFKAYVLSSNVADWGGDKASVQKIFYVNVIDSSNLFTTFKVFGVKKLGRNIPVTNLYEAQTVGQDLKINVPGSSDVTKVITHFEVPNGSVVKIGDVVQQSDFTQNDFTNQVIYTITAPNGDAKSYTVSLIRQDLKKEAVISSWNIPEFGVKGQFSQNKDTINLIFPFGTDMTKSYKANFEKSELSVVKRKSQILTSGTTALSYAAPVAIKITAEDTSISNTYVLNPLMGTGISKALLVGDPVLNPIPASNINNTTDSIEFRVLKGTNLNAIALDFKFNPLNPQVKILAENGADVDKGFVNNSTKVNLSKPLKIRVSDPKLGTKEYVIFATILE